MVLARETQCRVPCLHVATREGLKPLEVGKNDIEFYGEKGRILRVRPLQ